MKRNSNQSHIEVKLNYHQALGQKLGGNENLKLIEFQQ